ncbi:hypothetical protein BU14_0404s0020 [Porphyra umbilicalis]|uniref:Uncharacterized protein n=1 Tax=Porphyra umbilicalis TaxID=2786 RepID=A0A1X6NWN6_PORUM|nr:hypothetical protein BU14_0404s0020 [Porphyra umbilicalis]|eukprot:OSX72793.1 hypothetical protein BU14_0404s0020 [Porphyra umbilicalis]
MDDAVVSADAAHLCATPGVRPDYFAAARHTPQGRPAAGRTMDAAAHCGAQPHWSDVRCSPPSSIIPCHVRLRRCPAGRVRYRARPAAGPPLGLTCCGLVPLSFSPARGRKAQHG